MLGKQAMSASARPQKITFADMRDQGVRGLPLSMRKTNLARLLARRPDGIFVAPFEQGEIGPELFRVACDMGLEGLVSKRRDRPYQAGRSKAWLKIKNRKHPAMSRVMEAFRRRLPLGSLEAE